MNNMTDCPEGTKDAGETASKLYMTDTGKFPLFALSFSALPFYPNKPGDAGLWREQLFKMRN